MTLAHADPPAQTALHRMRPSPFDVPPQKEPIMNIAPHLTPSIAAGAVLAAAMLVLLGADDAADQAAPIRALARAQGLVERQGRVSALGGEQRTWRAATSGPARVADASTTTPARR